MKTGFVSVMRPAVAVIAMSACLCACGSESSPTDESNNDDAADVASNPDLPDTGEPSDSGDSFEPDADSGSPADGSVEETLCDMDGCDAAISDVWNKTSIKMDASTAGPDPELPQGITVRAGVYNVYGYNWAEPTAIGNMIQELDLDLVGIVESDGDRLNELRAAAGYTYSCHGSGSKSLLSKTPLDECVSLALDGDRSVMRTETTIDGVVFAIYVAHISWDTQGNIEARQFMDDHFSQETRSHVIMVGDFNDEHLSPQIDILEEGFADAFTAFGWFPGEIITWPSTHFDDTEGSQTIDLIFFRNNFRPVVVDAEVVNLMPVLSDHKPVWAEMLFPPDETPFPDTLTMAKVDPMRVLPSESERPANLLTNPGAEDGLNGWAAAGGAVATDARRACVARTGQKFFAGFESGYSPDEGRSELSQPVDLNSMATDIDAGKGYLLASAYTITCPEIETKGDVSSNICQPYDDAEVTVELFDVAGNIVDRVVSKRRDTLAWHPWADAIPVPPGTRSATFTMSATKRLDYSGGIDAGFDDAYLGFMAGAPHGRVAGNIARWGSAEPLTPAAGTPEAAIEKSDMMYGATACVVRRDGSFLALDPFATRSFGGSAYFFCGDSIGLNPLDDLAGFIGRTDLGRIPEEYRRQDGSIAVRWGGWVRSNKACAYGMLALDLFDLYGRSFATVEADPVGAAEWTYVENLTIVPAGIYGINLLAFATVDTAGDGMFFDELFVRPEIVE